MSPRNHLICRLNIPKTPVLTALSVLGNLCCQGLWLAHVQLFALQGLKQICSPASQPITLHITVRSSFSSAGLHVSPCWFSWSSCWSITLASIEPSEQQLCPWALSVSFPSFLSPKNLTGVHYLSSSTTLLKILNRIGPRTDLLRKPTPKCPSGTIWPLTTTFWTQWCGQFFTSLVVHPSRV